MKKQRMLSSITFLLLIFSSFFYFGCTNIMQGLFGKPDKSESEKEDSSEEFVSIDKDLWGYWKRMDNGDIYYVDDHSVNHCYGSDSIYPVVDPEEYKLESPTVMKYKNQRFFKQGGVSRAFSFRLTGFEDSVSRGPGLGHQHISARRENQKNKSDNQVVDVKNGVVEFNDAIPGDKQKVTISSEDSSINQSIVVEPQYSGENMGTIPVVQKGKYAFKVSYDILNQDPNDDGYLYANSYDVYEVKLHIKNIGEEKCMTSYYKITPGSPKLAFHESGSSIEGNFSSILPGASKDVSLKVSCSAINNEYEDIPINIEITDSKYGQTWKDCAVLRFYKGLIPITIKAKSIENNTSQELKAFLIYPNGDSCRMVVKSGETNTYFIPWSADDYILAFSGATPESEMGYSFAFYEKTPELPPLPSVWKPDEIRKNEPNDSVAQAHYSTIDSVTKGVLTLDDLDYYKFNVRDLSTTYIGQKVNIYRYLVNDTCIYNDNNSNIYLKNNNWNGKLNPGETIYFDMSVHNKNQFDLANLKCEMKSNSNDIEIIKGSYTYGLIGADKYSTSQTKNVVQDSLKYPESEKINSFAYQFKIKDTAKVGNIIPLDFNFTDEKGNSWTDRLELEIEPRNNKIELYNKSKFSDSSASSVGNVLLKNDYLNNDDFKVNKNEIVGMDFTFFVPKGSGAIHNIKAKLDVVDPSLKEYVTFYYKPLYSDGTTYEDYYESEDKLDYFEYFKRYSFLPNKYCTSEYYSSNYKDVNNGNSYPFAFQIDSFYDKDQIELKVVLTDQYNDKWEFPFTVPIVERNINIDFASNYDSRITDDNRWYDLTAGTTGYKENTEMYFDMLFHNSSKDDLTGVTVTLKTVSSCIDLLDSYSDTPNISKFYPVGGGLGSKLEKNTYFTMCKQNVKYPDDSVFYDIKFYEHNIKYDCYHIKVGNTFLSNSEVLEFIFTDSSGATDTLKLNFGN